LPASNDGGGISTSTPSTTTIPGHPTSSVELPSGQLESALVGFGWGGVGNVDRIRATLEAL